MFNGIYNIKNKYKNKTYYDYLTEADLKRNDYVSNFYKQHPCLKKDCAMAYQVLLYNKELTEEDKILFNEKLDEIRKAEDDKMRMLYRDFMKRDPIEINTGGLETTDMDLYIEKDKDVFGEIDLTEKK